MTYSPRCPLRRLKARRFHGPAPLGSKAGLASSRWSRSRSRKSLNTLVLTPTRHPLQLTLARLLCADLAYSWLSKHLARRPPRCLLVTSSLDTATVTSASSIRSVGDSASLPPADPALVLSAPHRRARVYQRHSVKELPDTPSRVRYLKLHLQQTGTEIRVSSSLRKHKMLA